MSIIGGPGSTFTGTGVITFTTGSSTGGYSGPDYLLNDDPTLVLFYPFLATDVSNNKLGNRASGSVVYDASLGYTASIFTATSFSTGRTYIKLDSGSSSKPITLPAIPFNKVYTCSFWCKSSRTSGLATNDQIGLVSFNSAVSQGYGLVTNMTSGTVGYPAIGGWSFNEQFNATTTMNSNDGYWHHYALVVNKGTGDILYIDGVYYGTASRGGDYSSWATKGTPFYSDAASNSFYLTRFVLGCIPWAPQFYLNGGFGDFRMYGKTLSPTEIKNLYSNGSIRPTTSYIPPTLSSKTFISSSIYTYTGANQSITIPSTATTMIVSCWGAGGASRRCNTLSYYGYILNSVGGGGGFTQAVFSVNPAEQSNYNVIVGGGGITANDRSPAPGGFGGGGGATTWSGITTSNDVVMNSGGGRSALQYNSNDIITAGGGGAGGATICSGNPTGVTLNGGAGGGLVGGNADGFSTYTGGAGGTQSAGGLGSNANGVGTPGSKYQGANTDANYAPGGGGYYGGGCGAYTPYSANTPWYFFGGGGGSSYISNITVATDLGFTNTITQATKSVPPNITGLPSSVVSNTIGYGGNVSGSNGGNGLVVISFYA